MPGMVRLERLVIQRGLQNLKEREKEEESVSLYFCVARSWLNMAEEEEHVTSMSACIKYCYSKTNHRCR